MTRTAFALALALAATLMLTGCTATSVATETIKGLPDRYIAGDNLFNGEPLALWSDSGLAVVTFGSSSCPPIPTSIAAPDAERIVVVFSPSPNTPCSSDLAPTTHLFELPSNVVRSGVTAELRFGEQVYEVAVE